MCQKTQVVCSEVFSIVNRNKTKYLLSMDGKYSCTLLLNIWCKSVQTIKVFGTSKESS